MEVKVAAFLLSKIQVFFKMCGLELSCINAWFRMIRQSIGGIKTNRLVSIILGFGSKQRQLVAPNPGHPWKQKSEISEESVLDVSTWPRADCMVGSHQR